MKNTFKISFFHGRKTGVYYININNIIRLMFSDCNDYLFEGNLKIT